MVIDITNDIEVTCFIEFKCRLLEALVRSSERWFFRN